MDLNMKIIEAVQKQPCLYRSITKMEERKVGWKQISEELKIPEQNLKIRWHSILQRYQTDDFFKYANLMQHFIERNIQINVQSGKWCPEFEITEMDLAEPPANTTNEYVFLEVDDLETTTITTNDSYNAVKEDNEKSDVSNNQSTFTEDDSLERFTMKCKSTHKSIKYSRNNDQEKYSTHEKSTSGTTLNTEKDNLTVSAECNVNLESKRAERKSTTDRCEDDIFGELVSAMLKRMDEDKKRSIKKEIMNILFT